MTTTGARGRASTSKYVSVTIVSDGSIDLSRVYNDSKDAAGSRTFSRSSFTSGSAPTTIAAGDQFASTLSGYWIVAGAPSPTSLTLRYSIPMDTWNADSFDTGTLGIYFVANGTANARALQVYGYIGGQQVTWDKPHGNGGVRSDGVLVTPSQHGIC